MDFKQSYIPRIRVDEALQNGWVEFWYQPKIDLARRQMVGFETFARIRHAERGVISASAFLAHAEPASAAQLSERALVSALRISQHLREMGIYNTRITVNMRLEALLRLPIPGIVQRHRDGEAGASLIFDMKESEVLRNVDDIKWIHKDFKRYGFSLAIDDFGHSLLSALEDSSFEGHLKRLFDTFTQLKGKFTEMKLDRSIVVGCGTDSRKRALCGQVITLAHSLGSQAVAVQVERSEDLAALQEMGCDIGQGFFLGEPVHEETFIMQLWQRAVRRDGNQLEHILNRLMAEPGTRTRLRPASALQRAI